MKHSLSLSAAIVAIAIAAPAAAKPAAGPAGATSPQAAAAAMDAASTRAAQTVAKMTVDEKTVLTHGIMPLPFVENGPPIPAEAVPGAGYVPGIPRLAIPALTESDASLGVAYVGGLRKDGATGLPSGVAQAASWNPEVLRSGGAMIGSEARAKGFNVLLAGGTNLMRDPRNGRTFEYLSEDPLLSGMLVGAAISGIQSNHIISTIKHYALNGQETARQFVDSRISESAARESDLLAFQIGIEQGQPGSVMCSYNQINGHHGCDNDWTLNQVLKRDWRWKGFVMSDWGALTGLDNALHGLDQQSGAQLDKAVWLGEPLKDAAAKDPAYAARRDDMNRRVLTAIYATGLDRNPVAPGGKIDFAKNGDVAEEAAKQGIVLLRNTDGALPLAKSAKRIAVIGGYADGGVLSGGGSSQVQGEGGPVASIPVVSDSPFAALMAQNFQRSSPMKAIKAQAPNAVVTFRDGRYIAEAVEQAKQADVAIVFATQWATEGLDQPDLSLPNGQDALIAAVAAANPHTIVVLETGGPVMMPWLDKTAAVIEAWFPGARGGPAIASVLFGETNPGGHLPITFPASLADLPRPHLDGSDTLEPNFMGGPPTPDAKLSADYTVEGSDVGYRWNARTGHKALFPFGFGLSYTSFASSGLAVAGTAASLTVKNTGQRAGAAVAQVYLVSRGGKASQRLVGFRRVELAPGASQKLSMAIDPRLLADWTNDGWSMPAGSYSFASGSDAEHLGPVVTVRMPGKTWKD
ncbi:beta-glucosidase family protein [Novosphingobium lentum]|uniref:beta-glucosidase family protein n=1 Tax=Novosphingobium lentum TaxID=145287 RepID=UPI00082B0074|nr:glycoside hydrolase family 3 C-terminal domain-containing protein [Novosphingobium lentum]